MEANNSQTQQNPGTERELIERHLPLVRNVVDRIKLHLPAHVDRDDLYSVGITGLIAAVRKYTPEQGGTFASYASTRIRGAILDELRRLDWNPRRARARAARQLERKLGRLPTKVEIDSLNQTLPGSEEAEESGKTVDTPLAELCEVIDDASAETSQQELLQLLTQRISELPDIPRKILEMYYFEHLRLAEIAAVFGLTESRICQIHAQTILGLRAYISRLK